MNIKYGSLYDYCMLNPEKSFLLNEWDTASNTIRGITPYNVTPGSKTEVSWKCPKCGESYTTCLYNRTSKKPTGCPYCCVPPKKILVGKTDLRATNPELIPEWDDTLNNIKMTEITRGSETQVYWICFNGHPSYLMSPCARTGKDKSGCPVCANKKVLAGYNDLESQFPEISREFDREKNSKSPQEYLKFSGLPVYWKCPKCDYSYKMEIIRRTKNGQGCPCCSHQKLVSGKNDFATEYPEVMLSWDREKNRGIDPSKIFVSSLKQEVFWTCEHGHSYKCTIKQRITKNTPCTVCNGSEVRRGINDFPTTDPEIFEEWDWTRNTVNPYEITRKYNEKVYWVCKFGHQYSSVLYSRTVGKCGCEQCLKERKTSFPEQALYYYLKKVFPKTTNRDRTPLLNEMEVDIYIPEIRVAIEYDGFNWHKTSKNNEIDIKKNIICKKHGITLYRIRENGCPNIEDSINITRKDNKTYDSLKECFIELFSLLGITIDIDLVHDENNIFSQYIELRKSNSLDKKFPIIASQWDEKNNGIIKPFMVAPYSNHSFYWICPKCGESYRSTVANRVQGKNCPYCAGKKVKKGLNDLFTLRPDLELDWDWTENEKRHISPYKVSKGSGVLASWKCHICGHKWNTTVSNRGSNHNRGCPNCAKNAHTKWTYELCWKEAQKYHSKKEFKENNSPAYWAAEDRKWLNDYYWFVNGHYASRKPVYQYDSNGIFVKKYESSHEACEINNWKFPNKINSCCAGKQKKAYGYIWAYTSLEEAIS